MALFNNFILFFLIVISISIGSESIESKINDFSSLDYSELNNSKYLFNIGYQNTGLQNNYFFLSIDKLISHNLLFSTKISKINYNDFGIFSQNTLSLKSVKSPINFLFGINYLAEHSATEQWIALGVTLRYHIKKYKIIIGSYADLIKSNNKLLTTNKFYFGAKTNLSNNLLIQLSSTYNPETKYYNSSLELGIKL